MNLSHYLSSLRRHTGIVILITVLFGIVGFILTPLLAPKPLYRATATAHIERVNHLTGLLHEAMSPGATTETDAAFIKRFSVIGRAAKKLEIVPKEASPEELRGSPVFLQAIQDLQKKTEVKVVEGTSLITIVATSNDPKEAARIANAVIETLEEESVALRTRQILEADELIKKQANEEARRLRMAEEQLRGFQEANRILFLSEETKISLNQLAAMEADHTRMQRTMGAVEVHLRRLEEEKPLDHPFMFFTDVADAALITLSSALFERVVEREYLVLTLPATDPQVKQADSQIAIVRQLLRDHLRSTHQSLKGKVDELERAIARMREKQITIPEAALNMTRMEREVKASERLLSLLQEKRQEMLVKGKEQVGGVSLIEPATVPSKPINPSQAVPNIAVGLIIGLVIGVIVAGVRETMDDPVVEVDNVESLLGIPVLGKIPHLDVKAELAKQRGEPVALEEEAAGRYLFLVSLFLPTSQTAEAFRSLRANLLASGLDRDVKTIVVTSPSRSEGKTTVAINLAIALAQIGKKTLLIEANLQNPSFHHAFGIRKEPGLPEVLTGSARLEEAVQGFPDLLLGKAGIEDLIGQPGIDNLDNLFLLPSGHALPNPAGFLSAQPVADFLAKIRRHYDYVIIDSTALPSSADSVAHCPGVDGTLLILQARHPTQASLRRTKAALETAKVRVLGVCLTGV